MQHVKNNRSIRRVAVLWGIALFAPVVNLASAQVIVTPIGTGESTVFVVDVTSADELIDPADLDVANNNIGEGITDNWEDSGLLPASYQWIYIDLGGLLDLSTINVWQYLEKNTGGFGETNDRGVKAYELFVGSKNATLPIGAGASPFTVSGGWTSIHSGNLSIGPSSIPPGPDPQPVALSLNVVGHNNVRYIGFDVNSNYGDAFTGLGQIQVKAVFAPDVRLQVDGSTPGSFGNITLANFGSATLAENVVGYKITSTVGALDPGPWLSIAENYDADNDMTIDPNDTWTKLTAASSRTDLSEAQLGGAGPKDGALIGAGQTIDLGNVWIKHTLTDSLAAELLLLDGTIFSIPVDITNASFFQGDLNFDGILDPNDWQILVANGQTDLVGISHAIAYQKGDLNGDGFNDIIDMDLFITNYDQVNGLGAFAAMLASVPEPSTAVLLVLGGMCLIGSNRKRRRKLAGTHAKCEQMRRAQKASFLYQPINH